jgi:hypothetical protein
MPLPPNFAKRVPRRYRSTDSDTGAAEGSSTKPPMVAAGANLPALPGRVGDFARRGAENASALDAENITRIMESARHAQPVKYRGMLVPNAQRYASRYLVGRDTYWSRFDEGLRDNWLNALALSRDNFVQELIEQRQMQVACLNWHIEADDPKDEDQKKAVERLSKMVDAIPNFQILRKYLLWDIWYGKYGSQVAWNNVKIDGQDCITIVSHEPVNGDSIVYKIDKTPGILIRTGSGWTPSNEVDSQWIEAPSPYWIQQADRGRAIFLYDRFWRDSFIISNYEPYGPDFLYEGDKAAAIFGYGLRGRYYWALQNRTELLSWLYEALQRIGANGMLYAFFESGNDANLQATIQALMMLMRDNVSAFPVEKGQAPNKIEHIEPSGIQYDIMFREIERIEGSIRRAWVGQEMSSVAHSTGIGSGAMEFQQHTQETVTRTDANREAEVLTRDLLGPMVRFNKWEWRGQIIDGYLPFRVRFMYDLDKANAQERSGIYDSALKNGVEVSKDAYYKDLGLSPPNDPSDVLKAPEPAMPGMPGQPGADGKEKRPTILDNLRGQRGLRPIAGKSSKPGVKPGRTMFPDETKTPKTPHESTNGKLHTPSEN